MPQPIPLRFAGKPQIPPVGVMLPGTKTHPAELAFVIVIALALPGASQAAIDKVAHRSPTGIVRYFPA